MEKKTITIDVEEIKNEIQLLRNSCQEALDGSWDYANGEGHYGFEAMSDGCEILAKILGIELDDYVSKNDEDEE